MEIKSTLRQPLFLANILALYVFAESAISIVLIVIGAPVLMSMQSETLDLAFFGLVISIFGVYFAYAIADRKIWAINLSIFYFFLQSFSFHLDGFSWEFSASLRVFVNFMVGDARVGFNLFAISLFVIAIVCKILFKRVKNVEQVMKRVHSISSD